MRGGFHGIACSLLVALCGVQLAGCRTTGPSHGLPVADTPSAPAAVPADPLLLAGLERGASVPSGCAGFVPSVGPLVLARDDQGHATQMQMRVLVDDQKAVVWLLGDWNQWGKVRRSQDQLQPEPSTAYFSGRIAPLTDGQRYLLEVNGVARSDPAATGFTVAATSGPAGVQSIFWDLPVPHQKAPDLHSQPLVVAETELLELVSRWPYKGGEGPANLAETYTFVTQSGLIAELKRSGYNVISFLPMTQSADGSGWRDRYAGSGLYAPDSRYGTAPEFAAMVAEFHRQGIAFVVEPVLGQFAPSQISFGTDLNAWRRSDKSSLFGRSPSAPTASAALALNDFDLARPEVMHFVADGALSFICRFGLAGLRLPAPEAGLAAAQLARSLQPTLKTLQQNALVLDAGTASADGKASTFADFFQDNVNKPSQALDMKQLRGALDAKVQTLSSLDNHWASAERGQMLSSKLDQGVWYYVEKKTMAFSAVALFTAGRYLDMPQSRLLQQGMQSLNAVDWQRRGNEKSRYTYAFVAALANAVHQGGIDQQTAVVDSTDGHRILTLVRKDPVSGKTGLAVINLSHVGLSLYRLPATISGDYRVVLNSDAPTYGGAGELERRLPSGFLMGPGVAIPYLAPYGVVILGQE